MTRPFHSRVNPELGLVSHFDPKINLFDRYSHWVAYWFTSIVVCSVFYVSLRLVCQADNK